MRFKKIYNLCFSYLLSPRLTTMAKGKATPASKVKRRGKTVTKKVTKKVGRMTRAAAAAAAKKPEVRTSLYRKLDLKARSEKVREQQMYMEAARVECVRLGIGAVKYLNPKNDIPQLSDCPLTMKDKSRLAANIIQEWPHPP